MYERSTNIINQSKKGKKIQSSAKAKNYKGMGNKWKRYGGLQKISNPSPYPLSLEKGPGARSRDLFERKETKGQPPNKRTPRRKPETQRNPCHANPGAYVFKKKDELALANRPKGSTYSNVQRKRIIKEVDNLSAADVKKSVTLRRLGVCRSTYYSWLNHRKSFSSKPSGLKLTELEKQAVIEKKKTEPYLSHRKISGYLRHDGHWISPSSCYRILKSLDWVSPQSLREAPWKTAHYEPFGANQIWGEDWTILNINGVRYYLLTIIDYFSRYIVAWAVVKTVTQREVKDLLVLASISEGTDRIDQKPMIRMDRGSPNMAHDTKRLIKELEMLFSPSRVMRPTDNCRQERWYRTVKQEEIYCYPTYPSITIARQSLARYIEEYNERRPHQALWNYTPGFVHRLGNKTLLLEQYRRRVRIVKEQRLRVNRALLSKALCGGSN